jgi:hypothetical protein
MRGAHGSDGVLAIFPDSDRRTYKPRPALVIQANDLNTGLAETPVAMTRNLPRAGHPNRVSVSLATPEPGYACMKCMGFLNDENLALEARAYRAGLARIPLQLALGRRGALNYWYSRRVGS